MSAFHQPRARRGLADGSRKLSNAEKFRARYGRFGERMPRSTDFDDPMAPADEDPIEAYEDWKRQRLASIYGEDDAHQPSEDVHQPYAYEKPDHRFPAEEVVEEVHKPYTYEKPIHVFPVEEYLQQLSEEESLEGSDDFSRKLLQNTGPYGSTREEECEPAHKGFTSYSRKRLEPVHSAPYTRFADFNPSANPTANDQPVKKCRDPFAGAPRYKWWEAWKDPTQLPECPLPPALAAHYAWEAEEKKMREAGKDTDDSGRKLRDFTGKDFNLLRLMSADVRLADPNEPLEPPDYKEEREEPQHVRTPLKYSDFNWDLMQDPADSILASTPGVHRKLNLNWHRFGNAKLDEVIRQQNEPVEEESEPEIDLPTEAELDEQNRQRYRPRPKPEPKQEPSTPEQEPSMPKQEPSIPEQGPSTPVTTPPEPKRHPGPMTPEQLDKSIQEIHKRVGTPSRPPGEKPDPAQDVLRALSHSVTENKKKPNVPQKRSSNLQQALATITPYKLPKFPKLPQFPKSALSTILGKTRGADHDYGDSTVESLKGLMLPSGTPSPVEAPEQTSQEIDTPSAKPKNTAERERQQEILQLRSMNARLTAARSSIRDANRNARHLENSVDAAEPQAKDVKQTHNTEETKTIITHDHRDCLCHASPVFLIWTGIRRSFVSKDSDGRQQLTWFGLLFSLFLIWYISEIAISEFFGNTNYATTMHGYGVNPSAPRYPYAWLTIISWIPPFGWLLSFKDTPLVYQATRTVLLS